MLYKREKILYTLMLTLLHLNLDLNLQIIPV